jgi:DNA gyrase/topoisomerase IV subunit B
MYIGATDETKKEICILDGTSFKFKEISYIPGFMKIIDEIIDNSIDEGIRTNFDYADTVMISYADGVFSIEDNGRGVPQSEAYDGIPQAVLAFTEARAGGNFDEATKANGIGMNGVGSYLTNVYSKTFTVETYDGKHKLVLSSINNAESYSYKITNSAKHGTKVVFEPDLIRFGMRDISNVYFDLIQNRCFHLAQCFPKLKFKLNLSKEINEWI